MHGGWDQVVLIYFVGCGVSRLARYNVTADDLSPAGPARSRYFEGTPIPTSVVPLGLLMLAFHHRGASIRSRVLGPRSCTWSSLLFLALGQPDDQQDAADPEALSPRSPLSRVKHAMTSATASKAAHAANAVRKLPVRSSA